MLTPDKPPAPTGAFGFCMRLFACPPRPRPPPLPNDERAESPPADNWLAEFARAPRESPPPNALFAAEVSES